MQAIWGKALCRQSGTSNPIDNDDDHRHQDKLDGQNQTETKTKTTTLEDRNYYPGRDPVLDPGRQKQCFEINTTHH